VKRAAAIGFAVALAVARAGLAGAAEAPAPKAAAAPSAPGSTAPVVAAPPPAPPPPYEPQLLRLAEMMGALAYLRDLCGQGDSADFRDKMRALLDAESADAQRRDRLAGAYNKGFQDYAISYRACGPSANAVIERYLAETARLTSDLANRYGG
jgi:uncharacterized protein (TIGR02301 family)